MGREGAQEAGKKGKDTSVRAYQRRLTTRGHFPTMQGDMENCNKLRTTPNRKEARGGGSLA